MFDEGMYKESCGTCYISLQIQHIVVVIIQAEKNLGWEWPERSAARLQSGWNQCEAQLHL